MLLASIHVYLVEQISIRCIGIRFFIERLVGVVLGSMVMYVRLGEMRKGTSKGSVLIKLLLLRYVVALAIAVLILLSPPPLLVNSIEIL